MSFVLDNSIVLAWCFIDEQTDAIMAVLDRAAQTGAVAPPPWPVEAVNALRSAERRKRIDAKSNGSTVTIPRASGALFVSPRVSINGMIVNQQISPLSPDS